MNKRGFTLIEMCLVLSLLGIVTAVAWPSFNSLHQRFTRERVVSDLENCMAYARANAIADRSRYEMVFTPTPPSYHLSHLDKASAAAEGALIPVSGRWGKEHLFPDTLTVELPPEPIQFFSNGSTSPSQLVLHSDDQTAVRFHLSGALGYADITETP